MRNGERLPFKKYIYLLATKEMVRQMLKIFARREPHFGCENVDTCLKNHVIIQIGQKVHSYGHFLQDSLQNNASLLRFVTLLASIFSFGMLVKNIT